ncbi:MAG TPA: YihY/virulence factor BrkB family protein [Pirellulales bacterium]|nr:YihY/virulence factor BrkB family protein [Pirellulales bacterium]
MRKIWEVLKATFTEWQDDRCPQIGAALAFYSIFSLPPMLLIAVTIGGAVLGPQAAEGRLADQLAAFVGPHLAHVLQEFARQTHQSAAGTWTTAASVLLLIISGTGAAMGLKDALNVIWGVVENPNRGWLGVIGDRLLALLLVFGFGALLLASTTLTAVLVGMGDFLTRELPFSLPVVRMTNIAVTGVTVMLLLAAAFKWLPAVRIRWREVWLGAAVTAVLFLIGKELIGLYLGRVGVNSVYGTAGSLVLVILWVYYSAQILLVGAEFTQAYAYRSGAPIRPADGAMLTAKRQDREEYLKVLRAERHALSREDKQLLARAEKQARRRGAKANSGEASSWSKLIWALGGLVLGWLIGVWGR